MDNPRHDKSRHEVDRVNVPGVARIGIGLAAMVVISMFGMAVLFRGLDVAIETTLPKYATPSQDLEVPPPRLDAGQAAQLQELRSQHRRILTSYEWVDEKAGIARIPIDRAIELVNEELPVRDRRE